MKLVGGTITAQDVAVGLSFTSVGRLELTGGTLEATDDLLVGTLVAPNPGEIGTLSIQGGGASATVSDLLVGSNGVIELRPASADPDGLSVLNCQDISFVTANLFPPGSGTGTAIVRLVGDDYPPCPGDSWVFANYSGTLSGTPVLEAPGGLGLELDTSVPGQLAVRVVGQTSPGTPMTGTVSAGSWLDPALWTNGIPDLGTMAFVYNDFELDGGCGSSFETVVHNFPEPTLTVSGGLLDAGDLSAGRSGSSGRVLLTGGQISLDVATVGNLASGRIDVLGGTFDARERVLVGTQTPLAGDVGVFSIQGGNAVITVENDLRINPSGVLELRPTGAGSAGLAAVTCRDVNFVTGPLIGGGTGTAIVRLDTSDHEPCLGERWVLANYTSNVSGTPILEAPSGFAIELDSSVAGELSVVVTQSPVGGVSWIELGKGLPGSTIPTLSGSGTLAPGCPASMIVDSAPVLNPAYLAIGLTRVDLDFAGGTLVPMPVLVLALQTDGNGALSLPFVWPVGPASSFQLYAQAWFPDAGAPEGLSATNGLQLIGQ